MKKIYFLLLALLLNEVVFSQSFQSDIVQVLKIHEDAENAHEQYKGLQRMEDLIGKYPNEWLPNYWAAYQCTQMAMLKKRTDNYPEGLDGNELLDRSEKYLKQAVDLSKNKADSVLEADVHALRSLIYGFRQSYAKDSTEYGRFMKLQQNEWKSALLASKDSPVMKVFVATQLGRSKEASRFELLASVELLRVAKKQFESHPVRALTTHFNQEWIPFWLPWLEQRLQQKLEE